MWFVAKEGAKGNVAVPCWGPFDSEAEALTAAKQLVVRGSVDVFGPAAITQKVTTSAPQTTVTPVVAAVAPVAQVAVAPIAAVKK